jgi:hypothetical protein
MKQVVRTSEEINLLVQQRNNKRRRVILKGIARESGKLILH